MRVHKSSVRHHLFIAILSTCLAACGGGGSEPGSGKAQAGTTAPAATDTGDTTGTTGGQETPSGPASQTASGTASGAAPGNTADNAATAQVDVFAPDNQPPELFGMPRTVTPTGRIYAFQPSAYDADGQRLRFSIQNQPPWASFNKRSGTLMGTPGNGDVGTFPGIVISASDGRDTVAMPAFSVTVLPTGDRSIVLNWIAPEENNDGTPLTDLSGFRIYFGLDPENLSWVIDIQNADTSSFVIEDLPPDTYFFTSTAVNADGFESDMSNIAVVTIT